MTIDLRRAIVLAAPAASLVLLAACHGQKSAKNDDQRTAAGQVLSGSISDAMLPYDATTSTPPLAPRMVESKSAVAGDADSSADSSASAATPAVAATEVPAPSIAN